MSFGDDPPLPHEYRMLMLLLPLVYDPSPPQMPKHFSKMERVKVIQKQQKKGFTEKQNWKKKIIRSKEASTDWLGSLRSADRLRFRAKSVAGYGEESWEVSL